VVTDRLARRYRRLLRVYPAGPRRDELLDTLLDCAGPDRSRPTAREAANLVRHGLRARLGRPGTTAVVVVFATLIAIATGFVGAAAANRLAWSATPSLPTGAAAERITTVAFPGLHVWGGGDAPKFVSEADGENIRYGYADYRVRHTPQTRDVVAYSEGVRDRLAAAGWRIGAEPGPDPRSESDDPHYRMFWATKDNLLLEYSAAYWPDGPWYDANGFVGFRLSHTESSWTAGAAVAGGVLAALAGWLLTGWASRRTERWPGVGGLLGVAAAVALILLLPALLLMLNAVVGDPEVTPFWNGLVHLGRGPALIAALVALLMLGALAAGPAWRRAAAVLD
jgi:hypothetical protein